MCDSARCRKRRETTVIDSGVRHMDRWIEGAVIEAAPNAGMSSPHLIPVAIGILYGMLLVDGAPAGLRGLLAGRCMEREAVALIPEKLTRLRQTAAIAVQLAADRLTHAARCEDETRALREALA